MARAWLGSANSKRFTYDLSKLTRHAAILGTTGSGKTVMGKVLLEEALAQGIPVIAIDPKGDIGSLGLARKDFDFRPFGKLTKAQATKTRDHYAKAELPAPLLESLAKTKTRIYTPKSRIGLPVNLTPDLSAPKGFAKLSASDPLAASAFIEPIAASLLSLAGISGSLEERAESFISALITHNWMRGEDLDIERLIEQVKDPSIDGIGSLEVSEVVSDKERQRIAAQLNTIISSPAKRAWSEGEPIDIDSMLKRNTLSVFDLRWATSMTDKQFVAERVMSGIYRALLSKGGSERLRFVLYIDELAGLLPPPPASPPSKRALELLLRQARAFGLGIVVATQNPGDIDSRLFGNIGTRFIGRLRTQVDIEKVATAMDLPPSELREDVSKLSAGSFVVSDAVQNKMHILDARWLASYHRGPLTEQEIGWMNAGDAPKPTDALEKRSATKKNAPKSGAQGTKATTRKASTRKTVSGRTIVKDAKKSKGTVVRRTSHLKQDSIDKQVKELIAIVKKHADSVQLRIELSETPAQKYTPHLRLVVESKKVAGLSLPLQGPFVFDMTSRLIPIGNYLKGRTFSNYIPSDIEITKHVRSVHRAITHARHEAKRELAGTFYASKIIPYASQARSDVEEKNIAHLSDELGPYLRQIDAKSRRTIADLNEQVKSLRSKRRALSHQHTMHRARRMVKRALSDSKLKGRTAQMVDRERRIAAIDTEIAKLKSRIDKERARAATEKEKRREKAYSKAHTQVRSITYRPKNDDLLIHAQVLLIRAKR